MRAACNARLTSLAVSREAPTGTSGMVFLVFLATVHLFLFQSQFLNVRAWHSLDIFFASAICF